LRVTEPLAASSFKVKESITGIVFGFGGRNLFGLSVDTRNRQQATSHYREGSQAFHYLFAIFDAKWNKRPRFLSSIRENNLAKA
jgi:hypothetical protein